MGKKYAELGIIGYFLLLAITVPLTPRSWGMQGIFFAMVIAAATGLFLVLLFLLIRRKMRRAHLTFKQLLGYFFLGGIYTPGMVEGSVIESNDLYLPMEPLQPKTRHLEPETTTTALVHCAQAVNVHDGMYIGSEVTSEEYCIPSIKFFLGNNTAIIGIRGAGKSNLMAVLCEEIGMQEVPLLLLDTVGEYEALTHPDYLPRAATVGGLDYCKQRKRDGHDASLLIAIDAQGAYEFGKYLMEHHLQARIHLPGYEDEEAAIVICEVVRGIRDWERNRHQSLRIPCVILMDEASKWLPQNPKESNLSDETKQALNSTFFGAVVDQGRKDGLSLVLAAQRHARLNKNALQCDWRFLMRQTEKADVDGYRLYGIDPSDAISLHNGECFLFSPLHTRTLIQVRVRTSPHGGHTPGLEELKKHYVAPVEYLPRKQFHQLPEQTGYTIPQQKQEVQTEQGEVQPRLTQVEQLALQAWEEGHRTLRKVHAWVEIKHPRKYSESVVYRALNMLETKGLIEWRKIPIEQ